jgi:hypothetical protein
MKEIPMKTSDHAFEQITNNELGRISGGDRTVVSPSESYQDQTLSSIDSQLQAMQGGGGSQSQMMGILQQMLQNQNQAPVTSIQSPGILGSIFGGTTKIT